MVGRIAEIRESVKSYEIKKTGMSEDCSSVRGNETQRQQRETRREIAERHRHTDRQKETVTLRQAKTQN
jgi:hypothetical protein